MILCPLMKRQKSTYRHKVIICRASDLFRGLSLRKMYLKEAQKVRRIMYLFSLFSVNKIYIFLQPSSRGKTVVSAIHFLSIRPVSLASPSLPPSLPPPPFPHSLPPFPPPFLTNFFPSLLSPLMSF